MFPPNLFIFYALYAIFYSISYILYSIFYIQAIPLNSATLNYSLIFHGRKKCLWYPGRRIVFLRISSCDDLGTSSKGDIKIFK